MRTSKAALLRMALDAIQRRTSLCFEYGTEEDAFTLILKGASKRVAYTPLITKYLNRQNLGAIVTDLRGVPEKAILITEYVNPAIGEDLKERGVAFMDAVGNAHIDEPPVYVFVTGIKPKDGMIREIKKTFHPAGLQVLFTLLCRPELVKCPLRVIAKYSGVSLGTARTTVEDLKKEKHIYGMRKNRKILLKKQLLKQWIMLYPAILLPKLCIGAYTPPNSMWWKEANFGVDEFLGGELAAALITQYLQTESAVVYTYRSHAKFVAENRLREEKTGSIEVRRAFWDVSLNDEKQGIVPALLIYSDLLSTGDPRNIEVAEKIYERELAEHFEED